MGQTNEKPGPGEPPETEAETADTVEIHRDTLPTPAPNPADFRQTLPTGAAFHATWKMPAWRPSGPVVSSKGESGVRRLDLPHEATESVKQAPESVKRDLGRTLLGMPLVAPEAAAKAEAAENASGPQGPHNDPRDTLEPTLPISPTRKAAFAQSGEDVRAASVQRIGDEDDGDAGDGSQRKTDPFGRKGVSRGAAQEAASAKAPSNRPQPRKHDTLFDGSESGVVNGAPPEAAYVPSNGAAADEARARVGGAPWAAGDVKARYAQDIRYSQYTDKPPAWASWLEAQWRKPMRGAKLLFVAVFFGALAGAALLLVSTKSEEDLDIGAADASGTAAEGDQEGTGQSAEAEPQHATEKGPHIVLPAPLPGSPTAQAQERAQVIEAPPPQPSAASGARTELTTEPANAEVVRGGAVIANTPTTVPRSQYDVDYIVRMQGYEVQLVRIGPHSPERISLQLKPASAASATPEPIAIPEAAKPAAAAAKAPEMPKTLSPELSRQEAKIPESLRAAAAAAEAEKAKPAGLQPREPALQSR